MSQDNLKVSESKEIKDNYHPLGKFSETGDQAENSIVVRHVDTAVFKMDNQALSLGLSGLW